MNEYTVCGYNIRDIQMKMLAILVEVDRLCKKYCISYVLDSGTLLGAVRHKGFIPWDDDIDIAMLRADYDKFKTVAKELRQPYVFEDMDSRKDYPNLFGKCYDTETRYVQQNTVHLDIQKGIFLDIFPMDNIDAGSKRIQCRLTASLNTIRCLKQRTEPFALRHVFYLPFLMLSIQKINFLALRAMTKKDGQTTDLVCPICQSGTAKPSFKRSMFENIRRTEFEGTLLPIPVEFDEYLHGYYNSPMELPPEEKRHPTHNIIEIKI